MSLTIYNIKYTNMIEKSKNLKNIFNNLIIESSFYHHNNPK